MGWSVRLGGNTGCRYHYCSNFLLLMVLCECWLTLSFLSFYCMAVLLYWVLVLVLQLYFSTFSGTWTFSTGTGTDSGITKYLLLRGNFFCCSSDAASVTTSKLNAQNIDCYRQIAGLMVLIASVCVFVLLTFLFQYATNNNYNYVVLCISVPIIYAKYWYWYMYLNVM